MKFKTIISTILTGIIVIIACSKKDSEPIYTPLKIDKDTVELSVGETQKVTITEGNGGYKASVSEDEKVAVSVREKTIIIKGKKNGETSVTVTDKGSQKATIYIIVKENIKDVSLAKKTAEIRINEKTEIAITQGSGKYAVAVDNTNAHATVINGKVLITGAREGTVKVTVTDKTTHKKAFITVTVKKKTNDFNVIDFGATPNDGTDDTKSFQDAIDAVAAKGGGTVFVPQGVYVVDAVRSIRLKSNITLKLDPKAKLIAKPNDKESYKVLLVRHVENVKIIGGTIQGERYKHKGTKGQWGIGVGILKAKNITIQDVSIYECWGDGIYVGKPIGTEGTCENITIKNVTCVGNRRQGMSITSANNVTVTDSEFSETYGHSPKSGIDIEPNKGNTVSKVTIKNCVFKNNAYAGLIISGHPNTQIVDILATENYFENNRICPAYVAGNKKIGLLKNIHFINNTFDGNIFRKGICIDCIIQDKSN